MAPDICRGHAHRARVDVRCENTNPADRVGNRDGDRPAAGAEIDDSPRMGMIREPGDRKVDEQLRLRPGNQDRRRHMKRVTVEFPLASQVRDRSPRYSASQDKSESQPLTARQRVFGMAVQPLAASPKHVREEHFRVEPGRRDPRSSKTPTPARQLGSDGLALRTRRGRSSWVRHSAPAHSVGSPGPRRSVGR
jgi:hypothetical protein